MTPKQFIDKNNVHIRGVWNCIGPLSGRASKVSSVTQNCWTYSIKPFNNFSNYEILFLVRKTTKITYIFNYKSLETKHSKVFQTNKKKIYFFLY